MEKSNATKRKKEKNNEEAPQKADKRKPIKYDWQQTNSEVTVTLYVGQGVNIKDVRLECSEQTCTVYFQDGRMFTCDLFRAVVPEGTDIRQKASKVIIKMVKRAPENWTCLQAVDEEIEEEKESSDSVEKYEDKAVDVKPVLELDQIKHDWYEKNLQTLSLNVYVPLISKDAFSADFQEDHFVLRFQTSDQKFLKTNSTTEDCTFVWRVNVIEAIIPKECSFRVSNVKVEVTLKKKVEKRWNVLEKMPEVKPPTVANSGWVSASSAASPKTESTISDLLPDMTISSDEEPKPLALPKVVSKKPTCLVSPLSRDCDPSKGMTGLDNLGNTCFMNSVLQCLANTREFRDYFLGSNFQSELNLENPLGTGGHLAVAFATLMRMLWAGIHSSLAPSKMKTLIGQKAVQFAGFAQHDAQELMAFLLDGLHEDLNRVKKKPYIENVDYDGQPDEVAAEESWKLYKKRNDSVVVDLFQGQYKSRLQCPVCRKVSITFDPFLYLSLPLPKRQWSLPIYFISLDSSQKPLKLILHLGQDATVDEVKEKVASQVSIKPKNLHIFEISDRQLKKRFHRSSTVSHMKTCEMVIVYEVLDEDLIGEPVLEFTVFQRTMIPRETTKCSFCQKEYGSTGNQLKRCTKCYRDAYCDHTCQKSHWPSHKSHCKLMPELVGCPFWISLPASRATHSNIMRKMEAYSRYSVDVFQPPLCPPKHFGSVEPPALLDSQMNVPNNNNNNIDCSSSPCNKEALNEEESNRSKEVSIMETDDPKEVKEQCSTVSPENNRPATCMVVGQPCSKDGERSVPLFQIRLVDEMGQNLSDSPEDFLQDRGDEPLNLKSGCFLAMDWINCKKKPNYALVQSKPLDFEWLNPKDAHSDIESKDATLDSCLQLFTEPEVLSPQEAWYCPRCKTHREATKELSLWRLPPILIVQLKRFSFHNLIWRDKIDKMVHFPVRGLDLSPYVQKPSLPGESPPVYDLFAVINHTGNILGGHYTAYARLPDIHDTKRSTLEWRVFDDSYVSYMTDSEIVSRAAYVLFYRRRNTPVKLHPLMPHVLPSKESKDRENAKILVQDAADSNLFDFSSEDSTSSQTNTESIE